MMQKRLKCKCICGSKKSEEGLIRMDSSSSCICNYGSAATRTGDINLSLSLGYSVMPTAFPADEVAIRLSVCMHIFPESKPCSWFLCEVEEFVVFKPSFRGVFGTCSERYQNHECKRYHHEQLEAWYKRQPDNNKTDDV